MQSLREELEDAELAMTTLVGRTSISLGELLNLKPGDILPCDFSGQVTLIAEDMPVFRGTLGTSRGNQAVKIEGRIRRNRFPAEPLSANSP